MDYAISISNFTLSLERPQPVGEGAVHLIFEPERLLVAPAVAAGGIDVQRHGHVVAVQGGVVAQAVLDGYHIVVVGEGDKGPWRLGIDLELVGVTVDKLRVGILPDEVVARPLVGDGRIHGDDGVEEYLEGRFQLLRVVCGQGRGQGVVAPSGADDHGTSRASAFGKEYPYRGLEYLLAFVAGFSLVGILFGGAVGPQVDVDGCLGLAVRGNSE